MNCSCSNHLHKEQNNLSPCRRKGLYSKRNVNATINHSQVYTEGIWKCILKLKASEYSILLHYKSASYLERITSAALKCCSKTSGLRPFISIVLCKLLYISRAIYRSGILATDCSIKNSSLSRLIS